MTEIKFLSTCINIQTYLNMSKQTKKAFDPDENMNRSDSREFLKLVSLNNFPVNIDQLLSNCNQTSAQLPQFKQTIKIKIKSYLPDLFFSSGCHVRPVFYLTKLDQPVNFKHKIEQTRLITSDRSAIHEIVTEVELPVFFKNEMRIFYFYQLETYENGQYLYKTEQLLEKNRFIRYINTSAFLVRKNDSRDLIIPKNIIDDIDGILLFGDLNNLVQMRKNVIELHFPIQFLNDDAILSDHVQFKKLISFFTNCYQSLVLLDIKYEDLFKKFLLTEFNKFISEVRTEAVLKSDSEYLSLLTIFYFSRRFKINLDFGEIFRLHNVNRHEYLKNVKDFFLIDDNSYKTKSSINGR
ncbi:hypothetical protein BpHYR1_015534 [Brachionus plicatilis]|uniref:Uncharacterized protein n=1 Tax=Brachionus plicatilis TaxID=10195 RepID=A0A3M7P351_BRAPC|nr:hypothetical protein BpHYR1_015534 [Brachionus plicatilis]